MSPLLGAHMSVAGGLPLAVDRAIIHGCAAFQIFAKNANPSALAHIPPMDGPIGAGAVVRWSTRDPGGTSWAVLDMRDVGSSHDD